MSKKKIVITIIVLVAILGGFVLVRPLFNKEKKEETKEIKIVTDEQGNIITVAGAKISEDEYNRLLSYFKDYEIDEMNDQGVTAAWENIDENFYCLVEDNLYTKMKKGICQESEEYYYCLQQKEDETFDYVKAINGVCN